MGSNPIEAHNSGQYHVLACFCIGVFFPITRMTDIEWSEYSVKVMSETKQEYENEEALLALGLVIAAKRVD